MRFSPCACDTSHYHRYPRRWWMRAFGPRTRYYCSSCKRTLLLRDEELKWSRGFLALVAAVVVATLAAFAVGYWENLADAAWKRSVSDQ